MGVVCDLLWERSGSFPCFSFRKNIAVKELAGDDMQARVILVVYNVSVACANSFACTRRCAGWVLGSVVLNHQGGCGLVDD